MYVPVQRRQHGGLLAEGAGLLCEGGGLLNTASCWMLRVTYAHSPCMEYPRRCHGLRPGRSSRSSKASKVKLLQHTHTRVIRRGTNNQISWMSGQFYVKNKNKCIQRPACRQSPRLADCCCVFVL